MIDRHEICFLDMRHSVEMVEIPGAYRFTPKGRTGWLQGMAWKLLHRFGALEQAYDSRMKVERRSIRADSFMERLFEQRESLAREFDRKATRLVIGSEDYAELMREAATNWPFQFPAEATLMRGNTRTVMGLTVEVLPWIRGMAVLP